MLESEKISSKQFAILVFMYTVGSSILIIPSILTAQAKQDAWIAAIIAAVLGVLFVILYVQLAFQSPNLTLIELCEKLFGKWFGKLFSFLIICYFVILATLILLDIGYFMTTQIIPETPIEVVHILFIAVSVMCVRLGLEVTARASEIFLPWVILLLLIFVFFLIPELEYTRIEPIFEHGFKPILSGALPFLSIPFLELIVFLMIIPSLNDMKKARTAFITGASLGGVLLIMITALTIFVLGADITARSTYPTYLLGKRISIGKFLERIEVIVAILWFLTIYFKLVVCFYASALAMAQTFKLSDYRPLVLPISVIIIALSFIMGSNTSLVQKITIETWPPFSIIIGIFIPMLFYAVVKFRGKLFSFQQSK